MEYSAQWTLSVIELLDLLLVNIFIIRDSHHMRHTVFPIRDLNTSFRPFQF